MSDDLFTLDLSGMDLKDLIQVVNEMDSKLNDKIIPKILEEVGDELISSLETRVRILQSQSQAMTFYYGKVDFPKFAELIEHDISDLKARK